jgi:hypothetical protein
MFLLFLAACTNMQNVNFVSLPIYVTTGHLFIHYCFCFFLIMEIPVLIHVSY